MKKTLAIICLIVAFFIIYFLQANFFSWFTIAKIKGFVFGTYLDLLIGRTIGISGILLAIIGFLGDYLDKNFSKESRITMILMVIGSTFLYEVGEYIYYIFRLGIQFELYSFLKILFVETIYNSIIVIILYPIIQKAGYALENTFKVKSILTRYF